MSTENNKETIIRQIEEICRNNDDPKLNDALKAIPQLLSLIIADNREIRQRLTESVEQSLAEYKPGFIIWLLGLLGFNKKLVKTIEDRINQMDVAEKTTAENPEEVLKLVEDLTEQLRLSKDENGVQFSEKEISDVKSNALEKQVNRLVRGYQSILTQIHKPDEPESELESIIIDTLEDIDAKVVWEKTEEDYGKMFRIINIPDDSRFYQNNSPCIQSSEKILCQGICYKIIKGEDK